MIVERCIYFAKVGKQPSLIEGIKAGEWPRDITQRLYIAQTGRRPRVVWEMEFENEEKRVRWWQSWVTQEAVDKLSELADHWETQFFTLVE